MSLTVYHPFTMPWLDKKDWNDDMKELAKSFLVLVENNLFKKKDFITLICCKNLHIFTLVINFIITTKKKEFIPNLKISDLKLIINTYKEHLDLFIYSFFSIYDFKKYAKQMLILLLNNLEYDYNKVINIIFEYPFLDENDEIITDFIDKTSILDNMKFNGNIYNKKQKLIFNNYFITAFIKDCIPTKEIMFELMRITTIEIFVETYTYIFSSYFDIEYLKYILYKSENDDNSEKYYKIIEIFLNYDIVKNKFTKEAILENKEFSNLIEYLDEKTIFLIVKDITPFELLYQNKNILLYKYIIENKYIDIKDDLWSNLFVPNLTKEIYNYLLEVNVKPNFELFLNNDGYYEIEPTLIGEFNKYKKLYPNHYY